MRLEDEMVSCETIVRAQNADEAAMEEVVRRFQARIRDSSKKTIRTLDGREKVYTDSDKMLQLQTKLLLGIMKFRILPEQEEE